MFPSHLHCTHEKLLIGDVHNLTITIPFKNECIEKH